MRHALERVGWSRGELDLTTPSGRALAGMLAVFAEFEREILRDRVRRRLRCRQQSQIAVRAMFRQSIN